MEFSLLPDAVPLEGYVLTKRLGHGGFGEVWKATHPGGGHVALKFILQGSPAAASESRALDYMKDIRHPNLLVTFGAWNVGPYLMIGMDLADGSLWDRLCALEKQGQPGIPFEELIGYLSDAARGIDFLNARRHPHPQGGNRLVALQHRDIKPGNLLLVGGSIKVGDWSVIRIMEHRQTGHTGIMSLEYAPPEFLQGKTHARSDQYSLAATYYRLRTGQLPYPGDDRNLRAREKLDLKPISDPAEREVLLRALACNPTDRWPSCGKFVEALRRTNDNAVAGQPPRSSRRGEASSASSRAARQDQSIHPVYFHPGPVVPPAFFIGREEELRIAREYIDARQSFLLVGARRAGKTSFCKKLIQDLLDSPNNKVLLIYLDVQGFPRLTIETFLEHTILAMIAETARMVFGRSSFGVPEPDVPPAGGEPRDDPHFPEFVKISRVVRERTHSRDGVAPPPLRTHEFTQFNQELLRLVQARGWSNFILIYDEANRLPREVSIDPLVSIAEALSLTGVVSIYVASPAMVDQFGPLRECFGRELPIVPFRNKIDLRRLLARYYLADAYNPDQVGEIPVASDALNAMWKLSEGRPFLIQLIADRAFRLAMEQKAAEVQARHVAAAYQQVQQERPQAFVNDRA